MNRVQSFFKGQHGLATDFSYDFALRRLCVAKEDSWRGILPSSFISDYNPEPPLFAAKFANCKGFQHILAIANEDGKIALQDITKRHDGQIEKSLSAPQCHYNAVFDLEWAPNQMQFVSASGDHTCRLWKVCESDIKPIRPFIGHTRSVKTAAFRRYDSAVFATGGRDGAIIIWDTRATLNNDMLPRADNCIYSGHVGGPGTPATSKRRTRTPKLTQGATSSSITGLAFQDTNTLISCGAGDGVIKVWDLRRNYTAYKKEPLPKHSLPYAGTSTFRGFTNLIVDQSGSRLYANCMDNTIYCYNLHSYASKPLAEYKGLLNSTFYIKSCLSPDGKYLLSGSSDERAYIWNIDHPQEPLVSLHGHVVEVTCVAWSASHDQPIVTCSDDARHKVWRIGPEEISDSARTEEYCGFADYVRQFRSLDDAPEDGCHEMLPTTPRSVRRRAFDVDYDRAAFSSGSSSSSDSITITTVTTTATTTTATTSTAAATSSSSSTAATTSSSTTTTTTATTINKKRSYAEMMANDESPEHNYCFRKQKTFEPRGRRLFGPSTSSAAIAANDNAQNPPASPTSPVSVRCNIKKVITVPSHTPNPIESSPLSRKQAVLVVGVEFNQENTMTEVNPLGVSNKPTSSNCASPLAERAVLTNTSNVYHSPPPSSSSSASNAIGSSGIHTTNQQGGNVAPTIFYSPTSNLPNYVLNGEAPHLSLMSPKRKAKNKVDWLTKIRKQKLMSSCRSNGTTLSEKINEENTTLHDAIINSPTTGVSSPRLQSLRNEDSPRHMPARRISHSGHGGNAYDGITQPKTPTSSRRNSETTLLRFFSVQTKRREAIDGHGTASTNNDSSHG